MDTAITVNAVLELFGAIAVVIGGCVAISKAITFITTNHDNKQKYDNYSSDIIALKGETEGKLQEIKAEQCMLTYCMMATLDGLGQLGANGKVTEARQKLDEYINEQAHA